MAVAVARSNSTKNLAVLTAVFALVGGLDARTVTRDESRIYSGPNEFGSEGVTIPKWEIEQGLDEWRVASKYDWLIDQWLGIDERYEGRFVARKIQQIGDGPAPGGHCIEAHGLKNGCGRDSQQHDQEPGGPYGRIRSRGRLIR